MIHTPVPAIASALALSRSPRGGRPSGRDRLPEGILTLIRMVAGDEQALADARAETGEGTQLLQEAANFYIQQVLFAKGASSYRVLGVDPDASDERIREHYRWLARWLHPDRNPDAWEVVFAERVSQAWQNMRTADRRERYDRRLAEFGDEVEAAAEPQVETMRPPPRSPVYEPALPPPPPSLRWLPTAIFGSLGIIAVAGVSLIALIKLNAEPEPEPVAVNAPVTEISLPTQAPPPAVDAAVAYNVPETQALPAALAPEPVAEEIQLDPPPPAGLAQLDAVSVPSLPPAVAEAPPPAAARFGGVGRAPPEERRSAAEEAAAAPRTDKRAKPGRVAPMPAPAPAVAAPEPAAAAVAAEAPTAPAPEASEPAPRFGQRDANRLINHFSRAYEDGDIEGLRDLFTADVQGPQGGLREILHGYEQLFGSSSERKLSVRDVNYFSTGETLTIVASYSATVTSNRRGRPRHTTGNLRLDFRRDPDGWRVYRLRHDERQG